MALRFTKDKHATERGATALLVVVFSVLLLMTISVSFMRLVVQDQQRTNDDELSRGAYDSALAGVEDGKRVLQACIGNNDTAACSAIASDKCNTVHAAKILSVNDSVSDTSEVMIQNSSGTTGGYNQAYTCVEVNRNTSDYQGTLSSDSSTVVPLQTTGPFTQITVSWFKNPGAGTTLSLDTNSPLSLPTLTKWSPANKLHPPIMRLQLIQFDGQTFNLSDFDQSGGASTLYLYPSSIGLTTADFSSDARQSKSNDLLTRIKCNTALGNQYVCSATITLPLPVGLADAQVAQRQAYLRLTSLYGDSDFTIQPVGTQFQDVEPAIDSTGRASNVYRRVRARVQLVSPAQTQLFPRATVDITHNFCKDFGVSDSQYIAGSCTYNQPTK